MPGYNSNSGDAGRQHVGTEEVGYDNSEGSRRVSVGRRRHEIRDNDVTEPRRRSRGRQVAGRLVARLSTAAASASVWRRPSNESASADDDSGFVSTAGHRAPAAVALASADQVPDSQTMS